MPHLGRPDLAMGVVFSIPKEDLGEEAGVDMNAGVAGAEGVFSLRSAGASRTASEPAPGQIRNIDQHRGAPVIT